MCFPGKDVHFRINFPAACLYGENEVGGAPTGSWSECSDDGCSELLKLSGSTLGDFRSIQCERKDHGVYDVLFATECGGYMMQLVGHAGGNCQPVCECAGLATLIEADLSPQVAKGVKHLQLHHVLAVASRCGRGV